MHCILSSSPSSGFLNAFFLNFTIGNCSLSFLAEWFGGFLSNRKAPSLSFDKLKLLLALNDGWYLEKD